VLGPYRSETTTGRQVSVGGPRLGSDLPLVAEAGGVVSVDRLIDRVWGGEPPPAAWHPVRVPYSSCAKLLTRSARATRPPV